MSKWSRLKAAILTAAVSLSVLQLGGCVNLDRVMELVAIGSIFD